MSKTLTLGLETLTLRVAASCDNCLAVAQYLKTRTEVQHTNYPGLRDSPWFATATSQFGGRYGGVLSFELGSKEEAFQFINRLKLIRRATNINDNRSLIIHPASTILPTVQKRIGRQWGAPTV